LGIALLGYAAARVQTELFVELAAVGSGESGKAYGPICAIAEKLCVSHG
jgi:hypothetical protein